MHEGQVVRATPGLRNSARRRLQAALGQAQLQTGECRVQLSFEYGGRDPPSPDARPHTTRAGLSYVARHG